MTKRILLLKTGLLLLLNAKAQDPAKEYLSYSWKKVATQMPASWYATPEARSVAMNVLFCQQDIGGWMKNKPYHHVLTKADSIEIDKARTGIGATIDNGATTTEMMFLAKIYTADPDERWFKAFEKGLRYLLDAQYANGGWPQFYPFRTGKSVDYAAHITYNDNAMVNVLRLLREINDTTSVFMRLPLSAKLKEKAGKAYEKGISCILKSQIRSGKQLTVWCAQHDQLTLEPANARAYELASFSGQESVGIVQLLMEIEAPAEPVQQAVINAMKWLEEHKINGYRVENRPGADGKKNVVLVADEKATPLLARFYDLETAKPFFCDRDGIKKNNLSDIGDERRNGYSWYSTAFENLWKQYQVWRQKWNITL